MTAARMPIVSILSVAVLVAASASVRADRLQFAPGVYILGVSHSDGDGAYSLDLSMYDDHRVTVVGDDHPDGR